MFLYLLNSSFFISFKREAGEDLIVIAQLIFGLIFFVHKPILVGPVPAGPEMRPLGRVLPLKP